MSGTIDIARLEAAMAQAQTVLKGALLVGSIWDQSTGLPLVGYNSNPVAAALLAQLIQMLDQHLATSGFPALDRFLFLQFQAGKAGLAVLHPHNLVQGLLIDTTKTNVGVIMSVLLPRLLKAI
ncbi:hypothetical protein [Acidocella sp.]|uniref:hypothetical protein n=1 Tax=Acidocella sp. TaxID=50710 RepID=UPI0026180779|nr:hypothetical protein [Acidocella sp.]